MMQWVVTLLQYILYLHTTMVNNEKNYHREKSSTIVKDLNRAGRVPHHVQ